MTEKSNTHIKKEPLYAVYAEAKDHQKPLFQLELTFARLINDIIVPYQTNEPFFIDGALITAEQLIRIKIVKLDNNYNHAIHRFELGLSRGNAQTKKTYGEQYSTRFKHILRQNSEDVTSQVLKAFNQAQNQRLSTEKRRANVCSNKDVYRECKGSWQLTISSRSFAPLSKTLCAQ